MPETPRPNHRRFNTDVAVFISATLIIFLLIPMPFVLKSCHRHPEIGQRVVPYSAPPAPQNLTPSEPELLLPLEVLMTPCAVIEGEVVGAIIPNSTLTLYRTSSTEFLTVLDEIRSTSPVKTGTVNESRGFNIGCLSPGNYALVIPTSSYRGSRGSALPYEFDCENLSLQVAFQGGDSAYAVGAFRIADRHEMNRTMCDEPLAFCRAKRGGLYRNCPLQ